ncbi:amidase [Microthyrium microscopicum]|uniref:amidase n=1 Tax=Microthyrium microscopicum TaxID=703497 RepID=A0A6A6URH2_9PEZI|nr:amidase [Microthyrium microscopicum]
MASTWQAIAKRKKQEQWSRIPAEYRLQSDFKKDPVNVLDVPRTCGLLSAIELDITESYDATSLADAIRARKLSAVQVTTAFCKRAAIAHQLTNCLTQIFFDRALARANELDAYLTKHKKPLGPFHGIPISLKDGFKIAGLDATIGYVGLAFKPASINSPLVNLLLAAGAVLYCKTNIPQTLSALDSHNNLFGRVLNPSNLALTAGGSSGGEGALIAMRGSVLGVGTDVGGSIRIPAFCNGVYGIKPSAGRVPFAGQETGKALGSDKVALQASAGPLAGSLRDCELLLRVVADMQAWKYDVDVVFGDWRSQGECPPKKEMVVGVVRRDGVIDPLPPVHKILDDTVRALKAEGIKVVEMDISSLFSQCQSLANALMGVEGGNSGFDIMESTGEPLSPWLQSRMKRKAPLTLEQTRDLHGKKAKLCEQFLEIWTQANGTAIDAIICPVAPHPVPPIDAWNGVSYTSTFVLLDYPAGYLPVRKLQHSDLEGSLPQSKPIGSWDQRNREIWTGTDHSTFLGSSLGVQVVVPRLQERRLCQAMAVIEDSIRRQGIGEQSGPKL